MVNGQSSGPDEPNDATRRTRSDAADALHAADAITPNATDTADHEAPCPLCGIPIEIPVDPEAREGLAEMSRQCARCGCTLRATIARGSWRARAEAWGIPIMAWMLGHAILYVVAALTSIGVTMVVDPFFRSPDDVAFAIAFTAVVLLPPVLVPLSWIAVRPVLRSRRPGTQWLWLGLACLCTLLAAIPCFGGGLAVVVLLVALSLRASYFNQSERHETERRCHECGYERRGRTPFSRCPECGALPGVHWDALGVPILPRVLSYAVLSAGIFVLVMWAGVGMTPRTLGLGLSFIDVVPLWWGAGTIAGGAAIALAVVALPRTWNGRWRHLWPCWGSGLAIVVAWLALGA